TKLVDVLPIDDVPELTGNIKGGGRPRSSGLPPTRLLVVRIEYLEGEPDTYLLPVVFAQDDQATNILGDRPGAGIITVTRSDEGQTATLCDTTHETEFWLLLYDAIAQGRRIA